MSFASIILQGTSILNIWCPP